jgi:glycosyltransferase involved in cell wall biosynthesis
MQKRKLLIISNALWLKTGLSRNAKALIKEWYKTGKYEIVHLCQGVVEGDPKLDMYPWKNYAALSSNIQEQQRYQQDPHYARIASYGATKVEEVIKKEKPSIILGLDDLWSFPEDYFINKEWSKEVNLLLGITFDSEPLLDSSFALAQGCHVYSWASFGERLLKEGLKKRGLETKYNIGTVPGAIDSEHYQPISQLEKMNLRKKFNIPQDAKIFTFVARNQLRKKFDSILRALASYNKQYPSNKCKIHLHTSLTEGWPIPKMIKDYDLNNEDILFTHVCSKCKEFEVKPYNGENQNCPSCGGKGCQGTVSITNGVADEEMKYIYGLGDAALSVFTSGGFEFMSGEAIFCGKYLASVGYSCGEDWISCPDVFPIDYTFSAECNSSFLKSEPNINSITKFFKRVEGMSEKELNEKGMAARKWAIEKFDSKIVAKQWMDIFDALSDPDYSSIRFDDNKSPNPNFSPDLSLNGQELIKHLYSGFLDTQHPDEAGMTHWIQRLENQEPKDKIAQIFQQIAARDSQPKGVDIKDLLLKNDKKNLFFVIKEHEEECLLSLSLLEGARLSYPNYNINIVTEPKFFDIFKGCRFVDNLLPYNPILEQELYIIGAGQEESIGDVFVMPTVATQKHLNYLSNNSPEMIKTPEFGEDWTLQTK